ncbi:Gfo/Idh/MocA family protein [Ruania zhangjianzhongii]|uniref:Gfo/Idh/MocA family protein n=1 Tax=Ruania zhangjianzhongii TaxID=2603206 RepID=UPI0022A84197|nr:Gfo/Idh/MocA family oxidoreductase [Ruania zhangjianzhongii]
MHPTPTPLRVGLIGAGSISRVHAPAWRSLGADVVVYSLHGADDLAQAHGLRPVASLVELWEQVDVVDIVTPTHTHADLALAAIARGKHVVCEKPLARTTAAAEEVVAAARTAGVRLFPAHVVRYFPAYARAHAAVTAGKIGRIAVCRFRRMSAAPRADWFFDEETSGGIVLDQMIHDLDQAEWFAGPAVSVFARSVTRTDARDVRAASATVTLTHASGAISQCYGVWGHPKLPFSSSFDIAGDSGVLRHDSARQDATRVHVSEQQGESYLPPVDVATSPYTAEIVDFAAAITAGREAQVTGTEGARAVQVAEAVLTSIRTGDAIEIPPLPAGSGGGDGLTAGVAFASKEENR